MNTRSTTGKIAFTISFFMLFCAVMVGAYAQNPEQERDEVEPDRQKLEDVHHWLMENPPNGKRTTRAERRERMAVIQDACDQLTTSDYYTYERSWRGNSDNRAADTAEEENAALYYLRLATSSAIADIHKVRVERGVAVWQLYNMGYVFKTPDACFGIDVCMRDAEKLADVLDFLLITHEHRDHSSPCLIDAMIEAGKPVITRWRDGTTIVEKPSEFTFGSCRVKIDIGDHHYDQPDGLDDMLMYQVDCGKSANDFTIYHSGDGSNYLKMDPDDKVDLFIVHVQVGMSVADAISHLNPRQTFVSHVLELGHSPNPPDAWRWSFDYAFDTVKTIPEDEATVLTWGERWLAPKTILEEE